MTEGRDFIVGYATPPTIAYGASFRSAISEIAGKHVRSTTLLHMASFWLHLLGSQIGSIGYTLFVPSRQEGKSYGLSN